MRLQRYALFYSLISRLMAFSSEFMAYFYLLANKKAHKSFIESNKVLTLNSLFLLFGIDS